MASENKQNFRRFIYNIFTKTIEIDKHIAKKLVSRDVMHIWAKAFTTRSVSPEPNTNLEILEMLGDSKLKTVQTQYLFDRFKDKIIISDKPEGQLTFMRQFIEDKDMLQKMAKKMGFNDWINGSEEELTKNLYATLENIFEAFIGAIYEVMEVKGYTNGEWYPVVMKLVKKLLDPVKIDINYKNPVTKALEIFKQKDLGLGKLRLNNGPSLADSVKFTVISGIIRDGTGKNIKMVYMIGPNPTLTTLNLIPYTIGKGFTKKLASIDAANKFNKSKLPSLFEEIVKKAKNKEDYSNELNEFNKEREKLGTNTTLSSKNNFKPKIVFLAETITKKVKNKQNCTKEIDSAIKELNNYKIRCCGHTIFSNQRRFRY